METNPRQRDLTQLEPLKRCSGKLYLTQLEPLKRCTGKLYLPFLSVLATSGHRSRIMRLALDAADKLTHRSI
jgi:hypothetical protein